jgi:hypothetical protein
MAGRSIRYVPIVLALGFAVVEADRWTRTGTRILYNVAIFLSGLVVYLIVKAVNARRGHGSTRDSPRSNRVDRHVACRQRVCES